MNIQLRAAGKCNNFGGNVPGGEVTGAAAAKGLDTVPIYFYYHLTAAGVWSGYWEHDYFILTLTKRLLATIYLKDPMLNVKPMALL